MSAHRALTLLLLPIALLAPAVAWAAFPKRGVYADVKLQAYLTTTKDAKALKSMTFPCQYRANDGRTISGGGVQIIRKVRISRSGRVSYSGKATVFEGSSPKAVKNVTVTARFAGGRARGTLTVKDSVCLPVTFSAKYLGENPRG